MSHPDRWSLALHSSSDCLGVGLADLSESAGETRTAAFPLGRSLSNDLFVCLESVLPASRWREIARLAVATGPGGFTGTRLTVVLARTLAQQLDVPLDGFSSFLLIARRLWIGGIVSEAQAERFTLVQDLPRRGLVAGGYGRDPSALGGLAERSSPRLYRTAAELPPGPQLEARVDPERDVRQLLELSRAAAAAGRTGAWEPVLPLYPTSPVENG
jgi:tRNA threonylcarbamoyl adenosine modification protein YeaZ